MSATDWYVCKNCRKKAIEYIDKWQIEIDKQYGKVDLSIWEKLVKVKDLFYIYRKAWEDEKESFERPKDAIKLFEFLENQFENFHYTEIEGNDGGLLSVRYDSDTGMGDDGILRMSEVYDCECCDFHIEVNKSWKQGVNQEFRGVK